jgi:hypothetical protein
MGGEGGRFLLANRGLWMGEMAGLFARDFPGLPVPRWPLGGWGLRLLALGHPRLSWAWADSHAGRRLRFDSAGSWRALGMPPRIPPEESLRLTAQFLLDGGFVRCAPPLIGNKKTPPTHPSLSFFAGRKSRSGKAGGIGGCC